MTSVVEKEVGQSSRRDLKFLNGRTHRLEQLIDQSWRPKAVKPREHQVLWPINISERTRDQLSMAFDLVWRHKIQECITKAVCD